MISLTAPGLSSREPETAVERPRIPEVVTNKTFVFVDYMKCIGILLIVYGHLPVNEFEYHFLWTFHVPAFFWISGFLTRPDHVKVEIRKKAFRLLIPYVSIYVITACVQALLTLQETREFSSSNFGLTLLAMFWGNPGYGYFPNMPLWFLPSLFTVEILFGLSATRWRWVLLAAPVISVWLYTHQIVDTFMSVDLSLLGLNFFVLGFAMRTCHVAQRLQSAPTVCLLGLAGLAFASVWWLAAAGNLWFEGNSLPGYLASFAGGVIGTMMLVAIGILCEKWFGKSRFVTYISRNTLLILGFHFLSNKYCQDIVDAVIRIDPAIIDAWQLSPLMTLAYSCASILLLMPLIVVINRWCPQIGGRPN